MTYDAVVVGGGIVGCACAHYLSKDLSRVALVEPGAIGGGATAAGMGHLVAMDDSEAQLNLTKYSLALWDEIAPELPAKCEYEKTGTLWIATDAEEFRAACAKGEMYRSRGQAAWPLDEDALHEAEPNLKEGLEGALLVPGDAVIYPMPVAKWLFRQSGSMHFSEEAASIEGSRVRLKSGEVLEAGLVVNATGDRASSLTPGLPILPRKGCLAITDRYPGFVRHQLVELGYLKSAHTMEGESVAFNVQPRKSGQILIGSSRRFTGWDSSVDRALVSKMLKRATEFVPGLGVLSVDRIWSGFRAATPDKLPLIGPWPQERGLWIAAGHEGLGITTSLATGKLLADLVAGRAPAIDANPYRPSREVHAA